MSRFNTAVMPPRPNTVNLAGGDAYTQDAKLALASLVTTNMVRDQYYRSADQGLAELRALLAQVDPVFAAKAAIYARNEDGIRSITHAVAGEIAHTVKGAEWTKRFYDKVVRRPDDATEILAYYMSNYGKPVPNSLKKGLGAALGKFDRYQIAKYRGEGKTISLVDVVNICHPKPSEKNADALRDLVADKLRSEGTWEVAVSQAGNSEDKATAKAEAWETLLRERKIGYFALLKNLRNIAEQAPELVSLACDLLVDEHLISTSLVLPFRYLTALRQLEAYPVYKRALSRALDLSLGNMPEFGKALIAVDGSGSMSSPLAGNPELMCKSVGSLFAAALYKKNLSDVIVFGSTAGRVTGLNPDDSTLTLAEQINRTCFGHSTNFHAIFEAAGTTKYETVIIFSDMQAWVDYGWSQTHPGDAFANYKRRSKAQPTVFAFDLAGYGSAQFPAKDVFQLSGFSDSTLKLMSEFKEDRNALVTKIEQVVI